MTWRWAGLGDGRKHLSDKANGEDFGEEGEDTINEIRVTDALARQNTILLRVRVSIRVACPLPPWPF